MRYFILRDPFSKILSIHQIMDAALASFNAMIQSTDLLDDIHILEVVTSDRGSVILQRKVYTYSFVEGLIINHLL
jgi:hypothetical protein